MRDVCLVLGLVFVLLGCLFVEVSVRGFVSLPEENAWVEMPAMRHKRSYFGTVVIDGKIYTIGGFEHGFENIRAVGTVEMYDPQTNSWTDKTPMPILPYRFATVGFMDKIYCIGVYVDDLGIHSINMVYDPVTDTWEKKTPMPTLRWYVSVCVVNERIYVMGGQVNTGYGWSGFSDCAVYDPVMDVWSIYSGSWPTGSSMGMAFDTPEHIFHNRTYVFDNREYVFDGFDLWIYDVGLDGWVGGPDLPDGLYGMGVVEVGGLLYVLSGCTATYSFPFYIYSPELVNVGRAFVYTPFGYCRVAPEVCVWSLEGGGVYDFENVALVFGLSHPVVWMGYSLNGGANVTIEGNVTLSGLSNGRYSVVVFAEDKYGNVGVSESITFTVVNAPLSAFFTIVLIVGVVVFGVVVCCGLFLFLRRRRFSKSLQVDIANADCAKEVLLNKLCSFLVCWKDSVIRNSRVISYHKQEV